jgi:hypothetical protein
MVAKYFGRPSLTVVYFEGLRGGADHGVSLEIVIAAFP